MKLGNPTIGIIGLGYVGLPLAVEFGNITKTIGFDINSARITELCSNKDSTLEVEPKDLAKAQHLSFTKNINDLSNCTIFIITVPTPIDSHNYPDLTPLIKASESVGKIIKKDSIVIYESTVYPGATEEVCVPILEEKSKMTFNTDFFVGYSPERINPGDKKHRLP
ncbi:MAG TPA: Vi polysaccharide biosynthesis UDP-N-acetylglucosamine C-6 dehydrogenase TviB, partial [Thiotrichaceae bacterium]|nr:Vi polysaccharide biosynthesis UDP-N-acetylglucosamine C-6 dehydrogenase TviB [Thiotrichaceae bacterium]